MIRRHAMILLPPDYRKSLRTNDRARRAAVHTGAPEPDPVPAVTVFSPMGAATWLATNSMTTGIRSSASPTSASDAPYSGSSRSPKLRHGRTKAEHWVPRWMRFAPGAYTDRGGAPTVRTAAEADAGAPVKAPDPDDEPRIDDEKGADRLAA